MILKRAVASHLVAHLVDLILSFAISVLTVAVLRLRAKIRKIQ